jgi:hypothetical protein
VRSEEADVPYRLLVAVGELWDGLVRAGIDPAQKGVHVSREYLGGYLRISAGPGSHPRLIAEWCESSQHFRVLRKEDWPGFESALSATVKYIREDAKRLGLLDVVDQTLVKALSKPAIKPAARHRVVTG